MGIRETIANWLLAPALTKARAENTRLPLIGSARAGKPVWTDWSTERAVQYGLKASVWVYAAIRKIATNASRVPWYVEALQSDDETWERNLGHPLEILIDEPNPFMTGQDLRERWIYHLWLGGNGVGHTPIVNRVPVEIWPLSPDRVKPVPNAQRYIDAYLFTDENGKKHAIDPRQIIHMQFVDPSNPFWGLSPLQAAAKVVDTDVAAVSWNVTALQNRTVKDLIYFPSEPMGPEQWQEARQMLQEQHAGPESARGVFLASVPGSVQETGTTSAELDWLNSRKFTREEIAAAMGIPLILLTGEGTYRNYETAQKAMWQDVIVPFLDDLAESLNMSLVPFWDPESLRPGVKPRLRLVYDLSNVEALQEDFNEKVTTAQQLINMGYTLNQVNQRLEMGFDDVPWGDQPRQALALPGFASRKPTTQRKGRKSDEWSEEQKTAFWKAMDDDKLRWEERLEQIIVDRFTAEGEAVAKAYEDGGTNAALAEVDRQTDAMRDTLVAAYTAIIEHFGTLEGARLANGGKAVYGPQECKAFTFDPFADAVQTWVRLYAAQKAKRMADTTKQAVAQAIAAGTEQDRGTPTIARMIEDMYHLFGSPDDAGVDFSRAMVIARTEVAGASGYGNYVGAVQVQEQTDLIIEKSWLSSRDGRVRESHEAIDGETVALQASFSNGLQYPGDPSGDADEVIQCRCVNLQRVTR